MPMADLAGRLLKAIASESLESLVFMGCVMLAKGFVHPSSSTTAGVGAGCFTGDTAQPASSCVSQNILKSQCIGKLTMKLLYGVLLRMCM